VRRAPKETAQVNSTNVFSNEAWSSSTSSYTTIEVEDTIDLSQYAATALPDTFSTSSRTPRYTPSPHSPQYEPSPNQTNSQGNPFDHAAYDGRPAAPLSQNAKYEDMPNSMRKRKLGGPVQGLVSDQNATVAPPQAPQASSAPTIQQPQTQAPQAYSPAPGNPAQDQQDNVAYRPAPQTPSTPIPNAVIPPAPQTQPAPQQTHIPATLPLNETIENEVPLSDFEKDFIEERIESSAQEQVIDLTQDVIVSRAEPIAPSIFSTAPVPTYEPIAYNTNDSVFGTQHLDVSDADRLYQDPKAPRETFQIDLDLFKNLFTKVSIKVVVIALVAIFLLVAAYLVVRPATSSSQNVPANSSESSLIGSEKTVVPPTDPGAVAQEPSVTLPQTGDPVYVDPSGDPNIYPEEGGGAIVTYDENGNAVYSSPTNQNFNGD